MIYPYLQSENSGQPFIKNISELSSLVHIRKQNLGKIQCKCIEVYAKNPDKNEYELFRGNHYANTKTIIRKLRNEGFIEMNEKYEENGHSPYYYKLTDKAIFYIVSGIQEFPIDIVSGIQESPIDILKNLINYYPNNLIFESFLYPLYERDSMAKMERGGWLIRVLYNYLQECYRNVQGYSKDLKQEKIFGNFLFSWDSIDINSSKKICSGFLQLKEFLKYEIRIDWIDNAVVTKSDENTIVISEQGTKQVLIKLNNKKDKATLIKEGKNISEFVVASYSSPSEPPTAFGVHLKGPSQEENALAWFSSGMQSSIFSMVSRLLSKPMTEWDIKILANDTKFLKILAHVKKILDVRVSEIMKFKTK